MTQRRRRIAGILLLATIACAWVLSLPVAPFLRLGLVQQWPVPLGDGGLILLEQMPVTPGWRDMLLVQLALHEDGVQQRRGSISWSWQERLQRLPLVVRADRRTRWYIVPVGTHAAWRDGLRDVTLRLAPRAEAGFELQAAILVRRPVWALDTLIGRALVPILPEYPPWPNILLVVAAGLAGALAIVWPRGKMLLWVVGGATASATLWSQVVLLGTLLPVYGPLDEAATQRLVPAYTEPSSINATLVEAAGDLPDGPLLVVGAIPDAYLVYRARYLLYPRPVTALPTRPPAAQLERLLGTGFVGLLEVGARNRPPAEGWVRASTSGSPVTIWSVSQPPAARVMSSPGAWAIGRLALSIGLVLVAGVGIAQWLGWHGVEGLAVGWLLGVGLLGWWMWMLSAMGIAWSSWRVAAGLLLIGAIAIGSRLVGRGIRLEARREEAHGAARGSNCSSKLISDWPGLVGFSLLLVLVVTVTIQAVLLPFTDEDTWKLWGLRALAFTHDGSIQPFLTTSTVEPEYRAYPPTHSLLLSWLFIALGGVSERLVKLVFPLWYLVTLGLTWRSCRDWVGNGHAMALTYLLATTPLLLDHATLANADLPLATTLLAGAIALCRWLDHGDWHMLLSAALLLGVGAWLKLDGVYLGLLMLAAAVLLFVVAERQNPRTARSRTLAGAAAIGLLVGLAMVWPWWRAQLGVPDAIPGAALWNIAGPANLRQGVAVLFEELAFSHSNSTWGLLGGGYGALWLLCGAAVFAGRHRWRKDRILRFLLISLVLSWVFYIAIYALRPFFSIERYLLHTALLAPLAAARALRSEPSGGAVIDTTLSCSII